jgi:hypothetical protein
MGLGSQTIKCPVRNAVISSLECRECANRVKVLFQSEYPPELLCSVCWLQYAAPAEDNLKTGE